MQSGKVKWFNNKKGYGFILPDDGGKDIFVHITAVHESKLRSLQDDQLIGYDVKEENGKICAYNLILK
ncbi:MAG: cold-shock protein [Alphaproteobacteria bacterium]|nr:cold-shock protein [Alphaproteobacteria bacterium]